ncbi:hypothetical protein [Treponema sp. R80B11-R83G3]
MLFKKDEKSSDTFWREYEEKTGEKVLTRGLGKYVSGWDEFDEKGWGGLWGLIINTSGGFRFHHFPQYNIFDSLTQFAANAKGQEKTIFIPQEKIISQNITKEEKLWKRIFSGSAPQLVIEYKNESPNESGGNNKKLIFEAEYAKEKIS